MSNATLEVGPVLTPIDLSAWGTSVRVVVTDPAAAAEAAAGTRSWLMDVDRACSRFRDDSELERVNRGAGHAVQVGEVLLAALEVALAAARQTDGLVTPTVGEALCVAGYDRTFALLATELPSDVPRAVCQVAGGPRPAPDWREVEVDHAAGTVRIQPGCRLDLGSTTKAWAADTLAHRLADALSCGVLVDLGGDLAIAGKGPEEGWLVQIVDGPRDGGGGPLVVLADGGLATSSTVVRRWRAAGEVRHHIIDPFTGDPADDLWRTVTVQAACCLDANTVSTAAVVLAEAAPPWLVDVGLPSRLVRRDGEILRLNGWPDEEDGE